MKEKTKRIKALMEEAEFQKNLIYKYATDITQFCKNQRNKDFYKEAILQFNSACILFYEAAMEAVRDAIELYENINYDNQLS